MSPEDKTDLTKTFDLMKEINKLTTTGQIIPPSFLNEEDPGWAPRADEILKVTEHVVTTKNRHPDPILHEQTKDELIKMIRKFDGVLSVDISYDMAPELAIIITRKEGKGLDHFMTVVNGYLDNVIMKDYTEIDWTVKVKGVKKLGDNVQRKTGQSEGNLPQPLGAANRDLNSHRIVERYGTGVINPGAYARAIPVSTD